MTNRSAASNFLGPATRAWLKPPQNPLLARHCEYLLLHTDYAATTVSELAGSLERSLAPGHAPRRLVLVGGGHAHVQVLRAWAKRPVRGVQLSLVTDQLSAVYSGMLPGYIAGQYFYKEITIDLVRLAEQAGASLIHAPATQIDARARQIILRDRPPLGYDVASINVGSTSLGAELPGVHRHALTTRPIGTLAEAVPQRLLELKHGAQICVVGGGVAGVELAFCCQAWLTKHAVGARVALLDAGQLLPEHPPELRRRVIFHAARRGVTLRTQCRVREVKPEAVMLQSGEELRADLVLWCAGAAPSPLILNSDLATDERGFLMCDVALQADSAEGLFAAGDCAVQRGNEWVPRAGVYAVRQGGVLNHNLRAYLAGSALRCYVPQGEYLILLNLGDGEALGTKWGRVVEGAWVWRLKDWIDRRFVERFAV